VAHSWPKRRSDDWLNHAEQSQARNEKTLISGSFTGGTIQVTHRGAGCTNQTFAVNGILDNVGPWYGGHGSGTFSATLTHYRTSIFGSCITYGASVRGMISLSF
jgi:hypothetical protein